MKPEIAQIRRDICEDCKRSCGVRATISHAAPCAACPARVWHAMGRCEEASDVSGLGDVVAYVAQPIARAIDRVLKTNVAGCGGCKARQTWLNKAVPFKQSP
jgi:hypothetical protein